MPTPSALTSATADWSVLWGGVHIKAAMTPTCIFREDEDVVGGGKARSASSSSGSRTCGRGRVRAETQQALGSGLPMLLYNGSPQATGFSFSLALALTMLRTLWVWLCNGSGRGGMCTHSGTVTVPPSRSATITSSCGPKGASGQGPEGLSSKADTNHSPYQLLGLRLEGCVDPNDEGCGCAEDLQQLCRQDGHISEAATGPRVHSEFQRTAWRGQEGLGGGDEQSGTCIEEGTAVPGGPCRHLQAAGSSGTGRGPCAP